MKCILVLIPILLFGSHGFEEPWGKDATMHKSKRFEIPPVPKARNPLTHVAEWIITFHQTHFSPIDGPRSHFRPTSSQYMRISMKRHGFIKGFIMGCDRLLRENKDPWVYRKTVIDGIEYKWDPTFSRPRKKTTLLKERDLYSLDEIADAN